MLIKQKSYTISEALIALNIQISAKAPKLFRHLQIKTNCQ